MDDVLCGTASKSDISETVDGDPNQFFLGKCLKKVKKNSNSWFNC